MPKLWTLEVFLPLWKPWTGPISDAVAEELDNLRRRLLLSMFLVCVGGVMYAGTSVLAIALLMGYGVMLAWGMVRAAFVFASVLFILGTVAWMVQGEHQQVGALLGALWVLHVAGHIPPPRALPIIVGGSVAVCGGVLPIGSVTPGPSLTLVVTMISNIVLGIAAILFWRSFVPSVARARFADQIDEADSLSALTSLRARVRSQLRRLLHHEVISFLKRCSTSDSERLEAQANKLVVQLDRAFDVAEAEVLPSQPLLVVVTQAVKSEGLTVQVRMESAAHVRDVSGEAIWAVAAAVGELARNARYHGGANSMMVDVVDESRLQFRDNGSGLPCDREMGQGLRLVRAGLDDVGAQLRLVEGSPSAGDGYVEIVLPASRATDGSSRFALLDSLLRAPTAAGAAFAIPFQFALAVVYSLGDRNSSAELVLAACLALVALHTVWSVCTGRRLNLAAQLGLTALCCALTAIGLCIGGVGVNAGYNTWVVGFSAFTLAVVSLVARGWVVLIMCLAHAAVVVITLTRAPLVDAGEMVGAFQASWATPALFYFVARGIEVSRQRLVHRAASVTTQQRDMLTAVAAYAEAQDTGQFLDHDIRPFLVQVRDGGLAGQALVESARCLEASARLVYAYPGHTNRWVRAQVAEATRRGVQVIPFEDDGEPSHSVEDLLNLLQTVLPIAPPGGRVSLSVVEGCGRLDMVPSPERAQWVLIRPWLPSGLIKADPWVDEALLSLDVDGRRTYVTGLADDVSVELCDD